MVSKKHQKMMESGSDKHHYYFPKKLYGKNVIMLISYAVHHTFHNYFMAQCKNPKVRACRKKFCRYEGICCYAGTDIEFGKKVI